MAKKMSRAECWQFIMAYPHTAKLATVRPDGRPHVVPIWFERDGEQIVFTTWHTTVKARNLRHSPWVSLCVDDEAPPFTYVKVDGTVTFSDDLNELRYWATRIGGRYMGEAQAKAFGARNAVPGELLARLTPTAMLGEDDIAGW
jgi:PPOX class probable F420-dependent enzyme